MDVEEIHDEGSGGESTSFEDGQLIKFLKGCCFTEEEKIIGRFEEENISYDMLSCIANNVSQIKALIPTIGDQIRFKKHYMKGKDETPSPSGNWKNPRKLFLCDTVMLQSFQKGRNLLSYYEALNPKPKYLEKTNALHLVHTICDWAQKNRKSFKKPEFEFLSKEIARLFECEDPQRYFFSNGRGEFGGLLFERYKNTLKKDPFSSKRKIEKEVPSSASTEKKDRSASTSKSWLANERDPEETILAHLGNSFKMRCTDAIRCKTLEAFWKEWPIFKISKGYTYIDTDFRRMYPDVSSYNFGKEFLKLAPLVIKKAQEKNKNACAGFQEIPVNEDDLVLSALYALSSLVRTRFKPSAAGCVDCFIKKEEDISVSHPYVVSKREEDGNIFFVYMEQAKYPAKSLLNAIEIIFKSCFVYRMKYPNHATHIFTFIQHVFFNIFCETDYKNADLMTIVKHFKN